ncbi:MFS transporter [Haloprofundus halobius]|uniref:MFS transporter n=1 Tax=Haloprofundus halobius TaxID=2876194 RepID=UPI001CC95523|nr:MFS transporter [Haloprofundus halobius]
MSVRAKVRTLLFSPADDLSLDLAALTLAQGIAALGTSVALPVLAPLLRAAGSTGVFVTAFGIGVLFAVLGVVRSVLQIPLGRVSDRCGVRKPFIELGLLGSAAALAAHAIVGSVAGLLAARALQGVALACSTPAIMATLGAVTDHDSRGGSVGIFSTVQTLGLGLGPIVGGVLATAFGVDTALYIGAALLCGATLLVRVGVPETGTTHTRSDEHASADTRKTLALPRQFFSSRRQARTLLGLAGGVVTLMIGVTAMIPLEATMLDRMHGGTVAGFGIVFASTTLTRLVAQYPVSAATDHYGRRRFVVTGLLCAAPLVALMGIAHSLWEFLVLRSLLGIALAGVVAPAYALAADVVDDADASAQFGLVTTAFSGGYAVGPVIAGALAPLGFEVPFFVAGAALTVGGVGVWWSVEEPHVETVEKRTADRPVQS